MTENEIVIIGGLGKTGGRVAARLDAKGVSYRSASRSTNPSFDWNDRSGWAKALQGARIAYVAYHPDIAIPSAADDVEALAAAALEAGIERFVLLSGRGEEGAVAGEDRLKASGINYTVLRCSWFNQNFSEGVFFDGIQAGTLALPVGDVGEPFVDLDDVADAAVVTILDPAHAGKTYELTGPGLLTFADAVALISDAAGREIQFVTANLPDFLEEMRGLGLPEDLLWLMTELFTNTLDGRNESVQGDLATLIGRPAKPFSAYAREAAAAGAWRT